jgi:hypothetical protein
MLLLEEQIVATWQAYHQHILDSYAVQAALLSEEITIVGPQNAFLYGH